MASFKRVTPPPGATPYNVQFSVESTPGHAHFSPLKKECADKASELLMLNHAKYHTLYNEVGLHNHIVHHLCSLWALGATPSEIQFAYDLNKAYQLPANHPPPSDELKMKDPTIFKKRLGDPKAYADYLHFFQEEIEKRGAEEVLRAYLFAGDEQADDLLGRLYSGFEHPILHLGFALEFHQPCLIAEALASATIHDTWPLPIVLPAESHLKKHPSTPRKSLVEIMNDLRSDTQFSAAVKASQHPNRIVPLMASCGSSLPPLLAPWRVDPTEEDVTRKTAEMVNVCAYMVGAAQHPSKAPAIEFFMMHSMNLSCFYSVFLEAEWLTLEQKARLLTWKGWMDLAFYAANATPTLYLDRIVGYTPKEPGAWGHVIARATRYPDDGHVCKLIRALLHAKNLSASYSADGSTTLPLRQSDFLQIAHMAMDSVERMLEPGYQMPKYLVKVYRDRLGVDEEVVKIVARFVRWAGCEGSWEGFPDLAGDEVGKPRL